MDLIAPETGLDLFEQAADSGAPLRIPAILDTNRLKTYYDSQGGVPPFLRSLLRPQKDVHSVETINLKDMLLNAAPDSRAGITLRAVKTITARILGHNLTDDLDASRSLRESGVDSLAAVLLRNSLAKLTGISLPANITLHYPDLQSLSDYLQSRMTNQSEKPKVNAMDVLGTCIDIESIKRGILDPTIQFRNMPQDVQGRSEQRKTAFVTGATGFFGAFMVHQFLENRIQVRCLTRSDGASEAQDRVIQTLSQYDLWKPKYTPLLHSFPGDLSRPFFGLSKPLFDDLADDVDYILHSGALVDWMRPLEDYTGPNILGTHEMLRLASVGRSKSVHFISTISTLPIHLGYGLSESDKEYGYGTSKYVAEKLVAAARFRGAKASTYRLPFIAAAIGNGQFRRDRGDFLNNLVVGGLEMGAFPVIETDMSSVLPVDYLCRTIAAIIKEDNDPTGKDYDFVNAQASTFEEFFRAISVASGGESMLAFEKWYRKALLYAEKYPQSCAARTIPILDGYTNATAGNVMKGTIVSGHVIGSHDFPCPGLDKAYVQKYLQCILASKLLG
ncbi:hypothetical protein DM02DRAFT_661438 [Periconia macrospinosa]|uniref:Carrier domain-containing protein n=1 Tax=Periconia macrospinosa TaxID=97972 RepID=A0A2V1D7K6_9PLEO|nr:hypothetical protein DM02DRAFT_661438 [Periconia macrospinosa]